MCIYKGARYSSVIDHPLMVRRVVVSIPHGRLSAISRSNQCSMSGVTKAVVCLWDGAYKRSLAANRKE